MPTAGTLQDVLVPEAQAIGMIGVIRSLGRAGYRVHAAAGDPTAAGLVSRFARSGVVHPGYQDERFLPWLETYVGQHNIRAIVPSEAFLIAVRPVISRYIALLPDAPAPDILYRAFSKADVHACLAACGEPDILARQPRGLSIDRDTDHSVLAQAADWAFPLFVKTDELHASSNTGGGVHAARDPQTLKQLVARALATHHRCLIQEAVPGVKATVNLWRRRGEIQAQSMCLALHENPHTGGLTSDRVLWWHEDMLADARRRLEILAWEGVAMVEYRWHASSRRFWFLELNARYWNALGLDLFADKDFPRWQLDAFFDRPGSKSLDPGPLGLRSRYTVPAEVGHVVSKCRDTTVAPWNKITTLINFAAVGLRPDVRSDLWFAGDRSLYWRAWQRFLRRLGRPA